MTNNISTTIKLGFISFGIAALLALAVMAAIHPQPHTEALIVSPAPSASSSLSAPVTAPEAASVATPVLAVQSRKAEPVNRKIVNAISTTTTQPAGANPLEAQRVPDAKSTFDTLPDTSPLTGTDFDYATTTTTIG